ncbi:MAG: winged helix-turn-helix domain-containing protein [Methanoregula sp.]|nr:winged helix-turn-helix domain-containing protein [Methanoregula sp.]
MGEIELKKLSVKNADQTVLDIQQEIGRSDDSRYDHRLHGVLLIAKGRNCYDVAEILGHSSKTIESWVHQFNDLGFEGLRDEIRPGRPTRISESNIFEINKDLRKNPRELGYTQNLWDGKLLSHHLRKNYAISMGVRQAQRLFHKLGFRHRKPRPVISKGDPVAQEAFKKNSLTS